MVITYAIMGVIGAIILLSATALIFVGMKMSSHASKEEENEDR